MEIHARMNAQPFPVLVERTTNNADPSSTRSAAIFIAQILTDFGHMDAQHRPSWRRPSSKGHITPEAENTYRRYLNGANGFNNNVAQQHRRRRIWRRRRIRGRLRSPRIAVSWPRPLRHRTELVGGLPHKGGFTRTESPGLAWSALSVSGPRFILDEPLPEAENRVPPKADAGAEGEGLFVAGADLEDRSWGIRGRGAVVRPPPSGPGDAGLRRAGRTPR